MKRSIVMVSTLALLLGGMGQAEASTMLVTSRSGVGGLNGTDYVDWGASANIPNGTHQSSPFTATSNGGVTISVSEAGGPFQGLTQGNGWNGNFANGDHLLYTGTSYGSQGGPVELMSFSSGAVSAAGAQIQADYYGSYTAEITAYDSLGNILGQYTENGVANGNGDNSAIFLGIQSSSAKITAIEFSLTADVGSTSDFAINQFDFTPGVASPVPEPATITMLGIGIVGLAAYGWRRRQQIVTA